MFDGDAILANPYHDKLGRFAKRAGAIGVGFVGGAMKGVQEQLEDPVFVSAAVALGAAIGIGHLRQGPEGRARLNAVEQKVSGRVPDEYKNKNAKVRFHGSMASYIVAGKNSSGAAILPLSLGFVNKAGHKDANISPMATRWLLSKEHSPQDEKRRMAAEHTVAHELVHTRNRNGRGLSVPMLGGPIEEGLTELLVEHKTGYARSAGYGAYSNGMARISMTINRGNKANALDWIDKSHKKSIGPFDTARQLSKATGKNINAFDVNRYLRTNSGKLRNIIGNSASGAELTRSFIKYGDRRAALIDPSLTRLATGAVEAGSAFVVLRGLEQILWHGVAGAITSSGPESILSDDYDELPPDAWKVDIFNNIKSYLTLEQITELVLLMKKMAVEQGIDPLDVEIAMMQAGM